MEARKLMQFQRVLGQQFVFLHATQQQTTTTANEDNDAFNKIAADSPTRGAFNGLVNDDDGVRSQHRR